jgi:hypothetical protein
MTTIRHPVQSHAWWYAAAAAVVLVGLLAVLMASVFSTSRSGTDVAPPQTIPAATGTAYAAPCFPGHPGSSPELAQPGCPGAR